MHRRVIGLCSLLIAAATCGGREATLELQHSALVSVPLRGDFAIRLPQGTSPGQLAFAASDSLKLADGVKLLEPDQTRGLASNVGGGNSEMGVEAELKDLWSVANVTLRDRAHVYGWVRSTGTVTRQNGVIVDGGVQQGVALGARTAATWSVDLPAPSRDVLLEPDQVGTLAPGSYGTLNVRSRAKLTLNGSGQYGFQSFVVEPQATVEVRNGAGPVYVFVSGVSNGTFTWRGTMQKQNASLYNVLFGYLGTQDAVVDAPFTGTVVAPNARINLISTNLPYDGSFFARSIDTAQPRITVVHRGFNPGDCNRDRNACSIGFGCADTNNNDKPDCSECPVGGDMADDDGDNVPNCRDACANNPNKSQPGKCGCSHPDTDRDGDGYLDCEDGCPDDPTNALCAQRDSIPPAEDMPPQPTNTPFTLPAGCTGESGALALPSDPRHQLTLAEADALINQTAGTAIPCSTQPHAACDLDPADTTTRTCATDGDCADLGGDYVCRRGTPTECTPASTEEMCQNKTLHCGRIDPACTANNEPDCPDGNCCNEATGENCTCQELSVCPEFAVQSSAPTVPDAYATLTVGSDVISQNAAPPPAPIYTDPPIGGYDCSPGNCWCRMGMYRPPEFSNPGSRPGSHGGGPLKVDFNPQVDFSVNLKPLAFGDSAFTLNASAKFDAVATVDLPLLNPISKPVLEMGAGVRAGRCNLSTAGAYFKVFGVDFVSMFGNRPFDSGDATSNPDLFAAQRACESALSAFTSTTDRAKKAIRDAQVLIEQYRTLRPDEEFEKASFCSKANSEDAGLDTSDCLTAPVEATINKYVAYANGLTRSIPQKQKDVRDATSSFEGLLNGAGINSSIRFLNIDRDESKTVLNQTFFVGPIPVNIAVDVAANYGVRGDLVFRFTPAAASGLTGDNQAQLVAMTGILQPSASANFAVFAGVGIDLGVVTAKAGIEGQLTLATIQANLRAGVGLTVQTTEDLRDNPADLAAVSTGVVLMPKQQYKYFVDYFYSGDMVLKDVLKGGFNAVVKLRALFFRKTFRKNLFAFDGLFDPLPLHLFDGGGQLAGIDLPSPGLPDNSLGLFDMQMPMMEVAPLPPRAVPAASQVALNIPAATPLHYTGYCDFEMPR